MEQSNDNKKKKQKQVEEILLMPIVCSKFISKTVRRGNLIYTGQEYYSKVSDEDMSDFAVKFYEIIYRNILKADNNSKGVLCDGKYLNDPNFAGDTMNSFKTISNEYEKDSAKWPDCLWEYFDGYHCLANFWLLPVEIGRSIKRWSKYAKAQDYMDRFLKTYKENQKIYAGMYQSYFSTSNFTSIEDFAKKHFLLGSYLNEDMEIEMYSSGQYDTVIASIQEKIKLRARYIAESEYMTALWTYFDELKFFN